MKLTIIGCSGSLAGPDSPASSYLISTEDAEGRVWNVLLDAGSGAMGSLQQKLDPFDLDAVVLTHLHGDHFLDMCGLEVYLKYYPGRVDGRLLDVYAPADAARRVDAATGQDTDPSPGDSPFTFHVLSSGGSFSIGPFTITPFRAMHPVDAYALRIEETDPAGDHHVLAYSGDSDACEDLTAAARGADLFLCEAGYLEVRDDGIRGVHLTGRRAGEAARDAGAERLVLTHIPPWTDPREPHREAQAVFDGPVAVAVRHADYTI